MSTSFEGKEQNKKVFINNQLQNLHCSLQYEIQEKKVLLGSSVSNTNEVYVKWTNLVANIKSLHATFPPLYLMSVDISRCFDTLPQEQILKLVPTVLKESSYLIRRFTKVKINQHGFVTKQYCKVATDGTDCDNFIDFIHKGIMNGTVVGRNVVFVDKVYNYVETRDKMLDLLKKHISCSIGKIGNEYIIQDTGNSFIHSIDPFDCKDTLFFFIICLIFIPNICVAKKKIL